MDILEEYQASNPLSESVLLEDIDEYEIYRYYLGFYPELRTGYNSPLRKGDESPSFSLFTNLSGICEYRWKDSGIGQHGTLLSLIKKMFNLKSDVDAIKKIRQDLEGTNYGIKNSSNLLSNRPKDKGSTIIKVKSKEWSEKALKWWFRYGITLPTLQRYNVSEIEWFSIGHADKMTQIFPKELAFAYREISEYQIYQPHNEQYKFRNNYNSRVILGFHQLLYQQDTLIITKSKKDVMCLYELGYESVACRSESTLVPQEFLTYFHSRYKRVIVLLDNDGKTNAHLYKEDKIYIPVESNTKDISDYIKKYSTDAGKSLIKNLILNK